MPKKRKSNLGARRPAIKQPSYLRQVARALGGATTGFLGGPGAVPLGRKAGDFFADITGMGDYQISRNTLMTNNGPPLFGNKHGTVVTHREFITDVSASIDFTNRDFAINPGAHSTFPWLSSIAAAYEQYELLGCVIEYKTTSGTAVGSTNTALGTVIMSTNYDVEDPPFRTKTDMEAYQYTVTTVPCQSAIHPIECAPDRSTLDLLYNRSPGNHPEDTEKRFFDLGNFQLAVQGCQSQGFKIGELWVSYHVKLVRPRTVNHVLGYNRWFIEDVAETSMLGWETVGATEVLNPTIQAEVVQDPAVGKNFLWIAEPGTYILAYSAIGPFVGYFATAGNPEFVNGAVPGPSTFWIDPSSYWMANEPIAGSDADKKFFFMACIHIPVEKPEGFTYDNPLTWPGVRPNGTSSGVAPFAHLCLFKIPAENSPVTVAPPIRAITANMLNAAIENSAHEEQDGKARPPTPRPREDLSASTVALNEGYVHFKRLVEERKKESLAKAA
jgi:hypothetical protein